ncbi:hypothetical protein [Mucilaginibacter kameinonensis]|uniref:hypothetical protein n=1 Tax=Mucilaginibacter kameinonensis TaxID=452286 RepID=UPI000EF81C40|nr:hypothetical protein [Mucilaginibacter kameinonensis]
MDIHLLKELLIPISTAITLLTISTSSIIGILAYRLNLRAEVRLKESAKAEIDAKLLGVMINLIGKANGRNGYEVSHDVIKKILDSKTLLETDFLNQESLNNLNLSIHNLAIISLPVGSAEQNFATQAIGELGYQHEFLRGISLTTLTELKRIETLTILCEELINKINSQ